MVHTVTLNPAMDKIFHVTAIEKGKTLRIQRCEETIGGKGTHVSINLALLGMKNCAHGVAFGKIGKRIISILRDYGVYTEFCYWNDNESRTNYNILDPTGENLLLAERGITLSEGQVQTFLSRFLACVQDGDILVLSGDVSNCGDIDVYRAILQMVKSLNVRICIDADGRVLKRYWREPLCFVKPNVFELSELCGCRIEENTNEVIQALRSLEESQIETIAVTMGKQGSVVKHRGEIYCAGILNAQSVNAVGCGDAFTSGFVYGLEKGLPIEQTIQTATALAGICAESYLCAGFDLSRTDELAQEVTVERVY